MRTLKKLSYSAFITLIIFTIGSCKKGTKNLNEVEKIVQEWTGKKIVFPDNIRCTSLSKDSTCIDPEMTPYKIVSYVDSTGCTVCGKNGKIDPLKPAESDHLKFCLQKGKKLSVGNGV
jgi:hypothetical protein